MREIKFRAWDTHNKKMIELGDLENISMRKKAGYDDDFANYKIMQYTGLKDKNGVEIYEGDILKIGDYKFTGDNTEKIYEVVYRNSTFIADNILNGKDYLGTIKEIWDTIIFHELYEGIINIEIIGNIYENPDLLSNK